MRMTPMMRARAMSLEISLIGGGEGRECQEDDDDDDENKNRGAFRSRRDDGRGEVWQQSTDCISLHWLWPSDEFDNGKED